MIAPCHSLQQNGLHLISPHHKLHHDTDRRNESAVFEEIVVMLMMTVEQIVHRFGKVYLMLVGFLPILAYS